MYINAEKTCKALLTSAAYQTKQVQCDYLPAVVFLLCRPWGDALGWSNQACWRPELVAWKIAATTVMKYKAIPGVHLSISIFQYLPRTLIHCANLCWSWPLHVFEKKSDAMVTQHTYAKLWNLTKKIQLANCTLYKATMLLGWRRKRSTCVHVCKKLRKGDVLKLIKSLNT